MSLNIRKRIVMLCQDTWSSFRVSNPPPRLVSRKKQECHILVLCATLPHDHSHKLQYEICKLDHLSQNYMCHKATRYYGTVNKNILQLLLSYHLFCMAFSFFLSFKNEISRFQECFIHVKKIKNKIILLPTVFLKIII